MRIGMALLMVGGWMACAWPAPPAMAKPLPAAPAPPVCKPGAPVGVVATLERGTARVGVRFDRAVADAQVRLHGTDGLVVQRDVAPLSPRFEAGATARFEVAYSSPPGGYLVVTVDGIFDGVRVQRVASFRVPGGSAVKTGIITRDANGRAVHVLPGETRVR